METWKTNLDETKKRYIDWWNHKGIILNMWEHFQEDVKPHADIPAPSPAKDLNQKWFDPQWRAEYLDWYVAHSSLKADILPVAVSVSAILSCRPFFILIFLPCIKMNHYGFSRKSIWKNLETFP